VRSPIFYQLPEHLGIALFTSTPEGPRQDVDETKPARFPDDFYVTVFGVTYLTPMQIGRRALAGKWVGVPVRWKPRLNGFMLEVEQLSLSHLIADVYWCISVLVPGSEVRLIMFTITRCKEK